MSVTAVAWAPFFALFFFGFRDQGIARQQQRPRWLHFAAR